MMDETTIQQAAAALLRAAPAGSRVTLFGSYATGSARPDGDIDFLVVEPNVQDRLGEMAKLSSLLGKMLVPADVVVVSRDVFDRFRDTPNTLVHRALKEGKVYESVA
ncbi:MAG: nucleotidyltransferase domain-containing protein [Pseudomonadota bacterium]